MEQDPNLLTEDNLTAAYGIYVYHIEAKGIGNKTESQVLIK